MKRLFEATRISRASSDSERCELCAQAIAADHEHLYDPSARKVRCACLGCALIIPTSQASPYRRVPKRRERIALDSAAWLRKFGVPVGIAAVIRHGERAVSAYPGPAGLVECEIDDANWAALRAEIPSLESDVEALICSNLPGGGAWIVGIDVLFEIVAQIRASWQGMSGGPEAPAAIARVLAGLEARA